MSKFKVGDVVVRTGGSANGIVDGGVYTVARYEVGRIWLVGHDDEYYSRYFELVEQKEVVELNGKKYNKQELEKALSLLKPIE